MEGLPVERALKEAQRLLDAGYVHIDSDDQDPALDLFRQALVMVDDGPPSPVKADALNAVGLALYHRHETERALTFFERARDVARLARYVYVEACAWHNIGLALQRLGHHHRALAAYEIAAPLLMKTGNVVTVPLTWERIARVHVAAGRDEAAIEAYERAAAALRDWPNPHQYPKVCTGLGLAQFRSGLFDEAERNLVAAARAHDRNGARRASLSLRGHVAWQALRRGRILRALGQLRCMLRREG